MLEIDNQTDSEIPIGILEKVYDKILDLEGKERKIVSLLLLDEGKIRAYNRKFRGKDSATDVISFASELDFMPTYGDIVIDLSVAEQQRENRTLLDEVIVLFIHGILHLLGYDHLSKRDKEIMQSKESNYYLQIKEEIL